MTWRVAALAFALLAIACDGDTRASVRRGGTGRGPSRPAAAPVPAEAPAAPRPSSAPGRRSSASAAASPETASPGGGLTAIEEAAEADEDPNARLSRDLAAAFGAPTSCLSDETRDGLEGALTLRLSVRVLPSGRVASASVSGSGLSADDRACMVLLAESLRLRGPIEDAPRTVTAEVRYEVSDTRTTTTERTLPDRGLHRGTLAADRVLPAAGTVSERPTGSVAPSRTLPVAGTADGRPPGFVAPGSTLPARAE